MLTSGFWLLIACVSGFWEAQPEGIGLAGATLGVFEAGIDLGEVEAPGAEKFVDLRELRLVFVHGGERALGVDADDAVQCVVCSLKDLELGALHVELHEETVAGGTGGFPLVEPEKANFRGGFVADVVGKRA